jgi:hypothetical protein
LEKGFFTGVAVVDNELMVYIDWLHSCLGVPLTHRLLNPDLAGGAILDLGPYPLTWVSALWDETVYGIDVVTDFFPHQGLMTLFHHPDNKLSPPTAVSSSMQLHPETGVDIFTTVVLDFPMMTARANCKYAFDSKTLYSTDLISLTL